LLELGLEALEQGESVGGCPGETGDHAPVAQPAYFFGGRLHHRLIEGNLSASGDYSFSRSPGSQDRGAMDNIKWCYWTAFGQQEREGAPDRRCAATAPS